MAVSALPHKFNMKNARDLGNLWGIGLLFLCACEETYKILRLSWSTGDDTFAWRILPLISGLGLCLLLAATAIFARKKLAAGLLLLTLVDLAYNLFLSGGPMEFTQGDWPSARFYLKNIPIQALILLILGSGLAFQMDSKRKEGESKANIK